MVSRSIDFLVQYNVQIDNQEQHEENIVENDSMAMHNISLKGVILENSIDTPIKETNKLLDLPCPYSLFPDYFVDTHLREDLWIYFLSFSLHFDNENAVQKEDKSLESELVEIKNQVECIHHEYALAQSHIHEENIT